MFFAYLIYICIVLVVLSFLNKNSRKQFRVWAFQTTVLLLEDSNFYNLYCPICYKNPFESFTAAANRLRKREGMAAEGFRGDDMTLVPVPESPRNKVKFLCSHGGKILPRPADGHLKYVGGETRVVSVPRDIKFSELKAKLSNLFDGDTVLKYQLIPEDLDALVSVKTDEDVRHMLDEYDRHESTGSPRLRAFLFPANPIVIDSQTHPMDTHSLEQRYIDAINGIIRANAKHTSGTNPNPLPHSISSTGSSPKSSESHDNMLVLNGHQFHMHKVQSSPSLCGPNSHHLYHHHYYPNHHRQSQPPPQLYHGYQSPRGGMPERVISVRSVGRAESWRYQNWGAPNHHHHHSPRHSGGSGSGGKCLYFDERFDITESFSPSPQ